MISEKAFPIKMVCVTLYRGCNPLRKSDEAVDEELAVVFRDVLIAKRNERIRPLLSGLVKKGIHFFAGRFLGVDYFNENKKEKR